MSGRYQFRIAAMGIAAGILATPVGAQTPTMPEYPTSARRAGAEGVTMLLLCIGADGAARVVGVNQSAGFAALDTAAREWTETGPMTPLYAHGSPAAFCGFELAVEWSLGRGGSRKNGRSEAVNVLRPFPEVSQSPPDEPPGLRPGIDLPTIPPFEVERDKAGVLTIDMCVDETGAVRTAGGFGSTGNREADLEVMVRYFAHQFQPATKNGVPVGVCGAMINYGDAAWAAEEPTPDEAAPN